MSDNTEVEQEVNNEVQDTTDTTETNDSAKAPEGNVDPLEAAVTERLAQMKANMDKMAAERDAALKAKAALEEEKKEAAIERMKAEGKIQEALEMELAELKAKLSNYEEENVKLKRDDVLSGALAGLDFKTDKARTFAKDEIVKQLVQNETGDWVHTSGTSLADFVEAYAKSEDNSFLFRVKSNTGGGTPTPAGTPNTDVKKPIGQLTTTEILDLARKGKLGQMGY